MLLISFIFQDAVSISKDGNETIIVDNNTIVNEIEKLISKELMLRIQENGKTAEQVWIRDKQEKGKKAHE